MYNEVFYTAREINYALLSWWTAWRSRPKLSGIELTNEASGEVQADSERVDAEELGRLATAPGCRKSREQTAAAAATAASPRRREKKR